MPSYGKDNFKESNVNYLNKDFESLKTSLMNYAKTYFPNSYRDFNETSPGMMLLEMNAYVGDTLSFYIDQQYRELMLPLAEERRNLINMAKMFGYRVKPIVPAYVDLTFKQELSSMTNDTSKVDYTQGGTFSSGMQVKGTNASLTFETLDVIDFTITGSNDLSEVFDIDDNTGLVDNYTLERTVRAVSGKEKTSTFTIGTPEKFKKLILSDTNIIDIISCIDANGNNWYEVDFLAQDKVPLATHYTDDSRTSAYQNLITGETEIQAVPYSLQYIKTAKRFTRETNVDNTTSLVFGNGILKDGQLIDDGFIDLEQVGIIIPGQTNDLNQAIDPLLGDEYSTLGETPSNTKLTITYRVGGGINSNIPSNDLTTIVSGTEIAGSGITISDLTVTNNYPARGGKDEESIDEIREKAKAFFTTQNRCVTKEDYEARVMNIPAKFGNIAKVYVARSVEGDTPAGVEEFAYALNNLHFFSNTSETFLTGIGNILQGTGTDSEKLLELQIIYNNHNSLNIGEHSAEMHTTLSNYSDLSVFNLSAINIYVLAYNSSKQLVGNPITAYSNVQDGVSTVLMSNIKNYLSNFKILTDTIQIVDGYIVNFGVFFDVVAEKYSNKQEVKFKCIEKIKDYFKVEKMQFNQPIYISQLEYELMGVEGVRSINYVTITQHENYHPNGAGEILSQKTWNYSFDATIDTDGIADNGISGGFTSNATDGYGYLYTFKNALEGGIIRPPQTSTPTVFELKNPNENIKGRVR